MFLLANPNLPATGRSLFTTGAPLFSLLDSAVGTNLAPFVLVTPQTTLPGTAIQAPVQTTPVALTPLSGSVYQASGLGSQPVTAISSGGKTFVAATNPSSPQSGQFVVDPYQGTATLYSSTPLSGQALVTQVRNDVIVNRNYIPPPYPEWFYRMPIGADISWSISPEQQPQGSITLTADNRNIDAIRTAFQTGTLLTMFGVGFSVQNYTEVQDLRSQSPGGNYEISISLQGSCEYQLQQDVYYYGADAPNGNPAWGVPSAKQFSPTDPVTPITPTLSTPLSSLSAQQNVAFVGQQIMIDIPAQVSKSETVQLGSLLSTQRARPKGCFVEYWEPETIRFRGINDVPLWVFTDEDLQDKPQLSYQGSNAPRPLTSANLLPPQPIAGALPSTITLPALLTAKPEDASLIGKPVEYPKVLVSGTFSTKPEVDPDLQLNQGTSISFAGQQKNTPPRRYKLTKGDLNAEFPPENSGDVKTLSLNWDSSGVTTTLEDEYYEDSVNTARVTKLFGTAVLGKDIAVTINGVRQISGNPLSSWGQVRQEASENVWDDRTGHQTGIDFTGWELRRYITETDELETIRLSSQAVNGTSQSIRDLAAARLRLYQYSRDPLYGATRYLLHPFAFYYKDAQKDSAGVYPRFVKLETNYQTSFQSTANPEAAQTLPGGGKVKGAPYTKGRETFTRREIQILDDNFYVEFTSSSSAEGSRFEQANEQTTFQDHFGKPPEVQQRPTNRVIKNQYPLGSGNGEDVSQDNPYNYYLLTPPYTLNSPEKGSTSYEFAETKEEALIAAKTDMVLQTVTSAARSLSITVPFNGLIKPLHKAVATVEGVIYPSRVGQVANKLKVMGIVDGLMYVEGVSNATLTPDADPSNVTLEKQLKPSTDDQLDPSQAPLINVRQYSKGFTLGGSVPNYLVTRRNF